MEDFEKVEAIMRYMYYSCYHWENELRQVEENLRRSPRGDPHAVLEYFKVKSQKELYDRVFADISKILYGW